jgi:hypothetical protein
MVDVLGMGNRVRSALHLPLFAMLACSHPPEAAETHRVTLAKTDLLPAMTITVPTIMDGPFALSSFKDKPNAGYTLFGSDDPGSRPEMFGATIRVERDEGLKLLCRSELVTERLAGHEVQRCADSNEMTVLIPHAGGDIRCWSRWQVMGELTPARRGLGEAVDASCTTIAFE